MKKRPHLFEPRLDILPAAQRRLWPDLQETPPDFTLYGGTAIALRLAHRRSVDFDFFSSKPLSGERLLTEISYLAKAKVRQVAPNTLTCSVNRSGAVRLSYFGGLALGQVDPAEAAEGPMILVASLRDLAATKLSVITQRAEAKDYLDIHALLKDARLPLAEMLGAARAVFGPRFDPLHALKALAYLDDPALAKLKPGMKRDLRAAIRTVNPERLPAIKPVRKYKAKA